MHIHPVRLHVAIFFDHVLKIDNDLFDIGCLPNIQSFLLLDFTIQVLQLCLQYLEIVIDWTLICNSLLFFCHEALFSFF